MTQTVDMIPKESIVKIFKAVEQKLSPIAIQKLLYLELLHNIIQAHPEKTFSLSSPTSPYFIEGHKAPLKHASLILRILSKNKLPDVLLRPQNPSQIVDFMQLLWQKACEKQESHCLQDKATLCLQHANDVELFEYLFAFGQEYFTFCLERI